MVQDLFVPKCNPEHDFNICKTRSSTMLFLLCLNYFAKNKYQKRQKRVLFIDRLLSKIDWISMLLFFWVVTQMRLIIPVRIPHACRLLNFEQGVVNGMQAVSFRRESVSNSSGVLNCAVNLPKSDLREGWKEEVAPGELDTELMVVVNAIDRWGPQRRGLGSP